MFERKRKLTSLEAKVRQEVTKDDQKACWKTGTKRKVSWAGDERRERNRRKDRLLGNSNYTLVETSNPSIESEKDG